MLHNIMSNRIISMTPFSQATEQHNANKTKQYKKVTNSTKSVQNYLCPNYVRNVVKLHISLI